MSIEVIAFGVAGRMVQHPFDVAQLGLGRAVFVRISQDDCSFTSHSQDGAEEFRVVEITRSKPDGARLVTLQNRMYVETPLLMGVLTASRGRLQNAEVERQLAIAAEDVPLDHLHDREVIARSRLKRIEAAVQRLALIDALNSPVVSQGLWLQQQSLVTYLLLTCFDLLGQHEHWVDFDTWLKSSRYRDERSELVSRVTQTASYEQQLRELWDGYNRTYGVRSSFLHFLNRCMPAEVRRELLDSIQIAQWPTPPADGDIEAIDDDARKQNWLISLRHGYTHRAQYTPGLHQAHVPPDLVEGWWLMEAQMTRAKTTHFAVSNWPDVLENAVRRGLVEFVRGLEPLRLPDPSAERNSIELHDGPITRINRL